LNICSQVTTGCETLTKKRPRIRGRFSLHENAPGDTWV
jgi:hypothetical protein